MAELTVLAPAKLNLTLEILRRREDGYHDLKMVMTSVGLCDEVTVRLRTDGVISVEAPGADLPEGEDNLAGKAARTFFNTTGKCPGADITILKRIPQQAGMAGGSSDAAAVLRALREMLLPELTTEQLEAMGEQVGSDVPYCVRGGTVLAEGRGEQMTDWPDLPACFVVLCKPNFNLSTPELFGRVRMEELRRRPDHAAVYAGLLHGELVAIAHRLMNVFEDVLTEEEAAEINKIKERLREYGAQGVLMTGSGPTVYGLFRHPGGAQRALEELRETYQQTYLARPM